jgi:AcrR family transcriptional regulator
MDRSVKNGYRENVPRPRQFDEEQVLAAVRDQFWDAGYEATSMQDLMRVTGLGKGSLYAAFGDKHQLFLEVLRRYVTAGRRALDDALATARAVDALRAYLRQPVTDSPEAVRRGCLLANSTCELAAGDAEVHAEARHAYETITAALACVVRRAQAEGDLPETLDAGPTARALLAAQQGLVYMGRSGLGGADLASTADELVAALLPEGP